MKNKVRVGVIGCGIISGAHMDAFKEDNGGELLAACDEAEEKLNKAAERHGVARRYRDWRELVSDKDVDAVVVCLPDAFHERVVVEAARRGKHVLVEKPMGRNLAESDVMIAAAERAGVLLMVGQVVRRFANHAVARQWVQEGRVGQVSSVVRRRLLRNALPNAKLRPWSVDSAIAADWLLYGFGAHEYDSVLWLLDTQAVDASAEGERAPAEYSCWQRITSTSTLRNGATARVELSLCAEQKLWETTIDGTKGTLVVRPNSLVFNGEETQVHTDDMAAFKVQIREFIECVREGREPGPSGRNVRATMAMLEAVRRSLEEGRVVKLDGTDGIQSAGRLACAP